MLCTQLAREFSISLVVQNKWRTVRVSWVHMTIIALFAAFVVVNGSIVVGDREAHRLSLHLAQLPYFSLFTAAAFGPLWLPSSMCVSYPCCAVHTQVRHMLAGRVGEHAFRSLQMFDLDSTILSTSSQCRLVRDVRTKTLQVAGDLAFLSAVFGAMIANGTIAHPYLLADNRHYTFYIWKNILRPSAMFRVCLAPLYAACVYELGSQLSRNIGWIYSAGFWVCTMMTLIPSGLLEFRYFTVPALLFIVHVQPPRWYWSILQIACFAAVNAVTVYIFAERPFFVG